MIIKTGEFEVVLQNTSKVFMNQNSGIVQLVYDDGSSIKSNKFALSADSKPVLENGEKKLYEGSSLYVKIQQYLNTQVKQDKSVRDIFKSAKNQPFFKELSVGIIGVGQIFGATDAFFNRENTFTLRSKSPNAEAYLVNSQDFLRHVETIDADKMNFR